MTHVTQEAQSARVGARQGRAAVRDQLVNSLFNPYTALCLLLLISGVGVALMDARGMAMLLVTAFLAAVVRLLWTIREELRETNTHQQAQVKLLRAAALRGGRE
ncbi:hypothetical protein [Deinococcus humi]|uniref:Uncharacterized protein n=1 Tax=Deinococcus humi TaxID=662880 RepID=A0A7W8K267_9DEIO|nr:hypothetical protein [Deinococcus humi]MBB5365919.1 hypothetical protein [Deinococcus humi]GGO40445.1 hypothetical protein GCM10008949_49960 [Deinococcus humi]